MGRGTRRTRTTRTANWALIYRELGAVLGGRLSNANARSIVSMLERERERESAYSDCSLSETTSTAPFQAS